MTRRLGWWWWRRGIQVRERRTWVELDVVVVVVVG